MIDIVIPILNGGSRRLNEPNVTGLSAEGPRGVGQGLKQQFLHAKLRAVPVTAQAVGLRHL